MGTLVLASKSPRRRDLLRLLGYPFEEDVSAVDEYLMEGESPAEHVTRLARMKARDVAGRYDDALIIGADTVVVLGDTILGKPGNEHEAADMLMSIQGRTHTVYTGFALVDSKSGAETASCETTRVTMRTIDRTTAERYVATGEPLDKAGSYGIQGYGAVLVHGIEGCYFNVMGLPLARLAETLNRFSDGAYGYFGHSRE